MKIEQVESYDISLTTKELAKLLGFDGEVVDVGINLEDEVTIAVDGTKLCERRRRTTP